MKTKKAEGGRLGLPAAAAAFFLLLAPPAALSLQETTSHTTYIHRCETLGHGGDPCTLPRRVSQEVKILPALALLGGVGLALHGGGGRRGTELGFCRGTERRRGRRGLVWERGEAERVGAAGFVGFVVSRCAVRGRVGVRETGERGQRWVGWVQTLRRVGAVFLVS